MNEFEEFEKVIKMAIEEKYDSSVYVWPLEIKTFSNNLEKTIDYILNYISDYYFEWMAEIFEDLVITCDKNIELINALNTRFNRIIPNESDDYKYLKEEIENINNLS